MCLQPQAHLYAKVCVSAYIYEKAPVYGDVSMHMFIVRTKEDYWCLCTHACVCVCVCVCVWRERRRTKAIAHI